jgi:hypothetical protein
MAVKFKLDKRTLVISLVVVLGLFALTVGRASDGDTPAAGTLDAAGDQACTEFARGYPQARSSTARLALADQVTASSQESDNRAIRERAAAAGASADETDAEWEAAADEFTQACRAAGWSAP